MFISEANGKEKKGRERWEEKEEAKEKLWGGGGNL